MNRPVAKLGIVIAFAVTLALGGCFKVGKDLPADAPAYVKLYPGAGQVVAIDMAGMKSAVFQAPASPTDVVAFYRAQAANDQLPERQATAQANAPAGQVSAVFGDPKSARFLVVVARPGPQNQGGSMVDLTYRPAPKTGS
jgi:hypothetical protein